MRLSPTGRQLSREEISRGLHQEPAELGLSSSDLGILDDVTLEFHDKKAANDKREKTES